MRCILIIKGQPKALTTISLFEVMNSVSGPEVRYYYGDSCSKYWLCHDGYQYPISSCSTGLEHYGDLVFSMELKRCVLPEYAVCPGNDFDGYINGKLIFPEKKVHEACGGRQKDGSYVIYDKTNFTTPALCGYRQVGTSRCLSIFVSLYLLHIKIV